MCTGINVGDGPVVAGLVDDRRDGGAASGPAFSTSSYPAVAHLSVPPELPRNVRYLFSHDYILILQNEEN
jgi:hypothetical protein